MVLHIDNDSQFASMSRVLLLGSGPNGEYLRRAAPYFSNMFTCKGLGLAHLPKCPLGRDKPWVPHAGAEL